MTTRMERKQQDTLNRLVKMLPGKDRLNNARRAAYMARGEDDVLLLHAMLDILADIRRILREGQ